MNTNNSINESLEVIRRALEDEKNDKNEDLSSNILILNQKVNNDGTIKLLQKDEDILPLVLLNRLLTGKVI